ncbi:PAS domain S-box protein [Desulfobacter sp.]|uniref:PAS domain S-box protein n=1 Tax=Desulfobacter sp. TaxID=2294 RepID=UPI000E9A10C4|nr:PAS domain S-box protein [Desulfobacter sp.]HBT88673.1 hypothetical protein [Desulfobacter sp.]
MKKESMLLPKKSYSLLSLITGSVVITISLLLLPGAWYIQTSFEDKLEIEKLEELNQINLSWASDVDRWLTDAKSSILRFSTLMSNLPKSENPDNVALFDTIVEPGEDGSFRSNRASFSPPSEAGIWIPKGPSLDSGTKNFFVQAKKVTQYFGQGALSNFKDTWILPRQGGIIIFWPDEPEWIYEATNDLDYASSQWVTLTRPDRNPQGLPQLTRASYDPAPGVWMLSIIAPYYRKGKWAGAVGHDFPISGLTRQMEGLKLHHGTTQFVIRRDGTLLISDQFSKDIKASNGHFQIEDTHDDALKNVFKASVNHSPLTFPDNIVRDGDRIFMIHHIQEADSLFITIIPEDALLTLVRKSYRAIWMLGGLALLLLTLIPVVVISRMVLPPVNRLVSGIKKVSEGNLGYRFAQSGSKELCYISEALDKMVRRISSSIEEDKRKEASLRKSEERFHRLFQMAPLPLLELSKDGRTIDINACFTEILGYTIEDIPTIDDWSEKVYPDPEYRKQVMTTWHAMVEQAQKENIKIQDAEYQVVTKDGSARTLLIGASLIFDRILLSLFDITDRKKAEEAIDFERKKLKSIFGAMSDLVLICDASGRLIEIAPTKAKFLYCPPDEIIGKHLKEIFTPEKAEFFMDAITKAVSRKEPVKIDYELTIDGDSRWRSAIISPMPPDRVVWVARDITSRKKMEEKLRQSEEKFSKIFSMTPCFVAITRVEDGNFIEVNNGFEDMTGWKKDEVLGRTSTEIGLWKTPGSRSDMVAALKAGKDVFNKEVQFKHKDGSPRTGLFSVRLIRLSGVLSILSIIQDITEIKKMEEDQQKLQNQLFQAQKMEAIGILAGGIAHDFNNILSALFGFTQLAKMEAGDNETLKKYLDSVSTAGLRARDLVSHILTFSRKSDVKKQKIFLNPIIKETLKFIRASLPSNIRIHQDLRVKRAKIMGDVTQIHQVLMNLFTNAGHAMKNKGGKLEVVLDMISINQTDTMQFNKIKPGRYYCLIISDTGCGIPHAIIDRIFEPFFTTKNREDGTGMGLSTVFGILKEMEGGISVYSEEGIGTTFKVLIPVHEQNGPLDTTRLEDKPISGEGNILIVDDEEPIVQSSQAILSSLGYSVTGTTSSREALKQIEKQPNFFDLVLTDMTMPEMDGLTLSRRIKSINPEIPIVLCTGFSHGLTKEMCRSIGIFDMLMKPMIAGELSKAVCSALKKRPGKETSDSRSDH